MEVMLWLNNNIIQNNNPNIVCLFAYGSRVYGTNDESSDRDYICIIKEEISELTNKSQLNFEDGDITFYTEEILKNYWLIMKFQLLNAYLKNYLFLILINKMN